MKSLGLVLNSLVNVYAWMGIGYYVAKSNHWGASFCGLLVITTLLVAVKIPAKRIK